MAEKIIVEICRSAHARDLDLPSYETAGAAGMDLRAALETGSIDLAPGERILIPTGLSISLPLGYEAQIRPRSGLAVKHGVTVLNSPGTIDSDYRGEIKIALINHGTKHFEISHGLRIAQMIIAPVTKADLTEVTVLDQTVRGSGGFGSTGT